MIPRGEEGHGEAFIFFAYTFLRDLYNIVRWSTGGLWRKGILVLTRYALLRDESERYDLG